MLQKYGISNLKGGSKDIKRLLEQNNFIENKDFELSNVAEFRPQGGSSIKNEYYLHPRSFKICLMRSKNTKIYAKYYLLLEECIKYYNDFQIELNKKYIIKLKNKNKEKDILIKEKDNKIDILEEKMNILLKTNKQILEDNKNTKIMNEKILEDNKNTKIINEKILKRSEKMELQLNETLEKLDITNDKLDDTYEELEITNEKLDSTDKTLMQVAKKLDIATEDRVIKTKKSATLEYFIIMYNNSCEYKYYIIRGQKRYINKKKEQLDGYNEIKSIECCPNANILWNLSLREEELKNNIDFCGNKLNLINLNQDIFLVKVDEIYNKRKNVNL